MFMDELIEKLQLIRKEHGNLRCFTHVDVPSGDCFDGAPIDEIGTIQLFDDDPKPIKWTTVEGKWQAVEYENRPAEKCVLIDA